MTREVDEKLHSAAPIVMIEAAGGCGKTTKAAKYAREAAERLSSGKVLLLSHTHAACGEFQRKCAALGRKIDVETCDSFCLKAIGAYPRPLGLPSPIESHLGRAEGGIAFSALSEKAAELFRRAPIVARAVAAHYPVIVLDEHQDAGIHQHETIRLLREIGDAHLRIFGDPMQAIHPANDKGYVDWDAAWATADDKGKLEEPHRWANAPDLGEWIMASRAALKAGNPVSLRDAPACVSAVSRNGLAGRERFRDVPTASREVHGFLSGAQDSAAILAFLGNMAKSTAQVGNWRAPLNEGAQLDELDLLIQAMEAHTGNPQALAGAFLNFLTAIGVGLTTDMSDGLRGRLSAAINRDRAGRNQIAWLDCLEPIYASPDHRGMAVAMRVARDTPPAGYAIRLGDHAWALGAFDRIDDPRAFRNTLGRIRRRRKWPRQMVSTIHKAKGLDFNHVLLCPVDRHQYPDDVLGARLLYVALSRAKQSIRLVLAGDAPTRHLVVR
ncbi:MAG TPA: ATP-dependent helicase [Acetobacteraceae bacterium]|nr:ATP-dependent helicase [Acetobacteraceae bacterium]